MRVVLGILCSLGLCVALFFALVALVAALDGWDRCPGIQCSDAIGTALFTGSLAVVLTVGSLAGLGYLASHRRR